MDTLLTKKKKLYFLIKYINNLTKKWKFMCRYYKKQQNLSLYKTKIALLSQKVVGSIDALFASFWLNLAKLTV